MFYIVGLIYNFSKFQPQRGGGGFRYPELKSTSQNILEKGYIHNIGHLTPTAVIKKYQKHAWPFSKFGPYTFAGNLLVVGIYNHILVWIYSDPHVYMITLCAFFSLQLFGFINHIQPLAQYWILVIEWVIIINKLSI